MEVNIGKIPRGAKVSDYPEDTVFVFEESKRPERDPRTGELLKPSDIKGTAQTALT